QLGQLGRSIKEQVKSKKEAFLLYQIPSQFRPGSCPSSSRQTRMDFLGQIAGMYPEFLQAFAASCP
ncbi:11266_t:CDS:1, partial [Gigaspora rosea]